MENQEWPYFEILGFKDGKFHYKASGFIWKFTPAQHNRSHLIVLAPLEFWESNFPSKRSVDWFAAKSSLIRDSYRKGDYIPEK